MEMKISQETASIEKWSTDGCLTLNQSANIHVWNTYDVSGYKV